jgi:hypothetical protein
MVDVVGAGSGAVLVDVDVVVVVDVGVGAPKTAPTATARTIHRVSKAPLPPVQCLTHFHKVNGESEGKKHDGNLHFPYCRGPSRRARAGTADVARKPGNKSFAPLLGLGARLPRIELWSGLIPLAKAEIVLRHANVCKRSVDHGSRYVPSRCKVRDDIGLE